VQTLKNLNTSQLTKSKKALIRADLDVPFPSNGEILEPYRLAALLPTLQFLLEKKIHPVICGHIGRPQGKEDPKLSTNNLKPFFDSQIGANNYSLLENLRFDAREDTDSPDLAEEFAKELISTTQAEVFINESFATCHRSATSITQFPKMLPSFAGLRLAQEVETLSSALTNSENPKIAIVGGVKSSKKEAVYALAEKFDTVLVVGKLAKTPQDPENPKVLYPVDYSGEGLDIGAKTAEIYAKTLFTARTVVWAGPAGAYDQGYFEGSRQIAKAILSSKAFSIIGGGDTIFCLNQLKMLEDFDFVSTGGGAMLDFLAGKKLPGLVALSYYE